MIIQGVILCGGSGSRLGSITKNIAKPFLNVSGVPFIEYVMQKMLMTGVQEILLLAGVNGQALKDAFDGKNYFGCDVKVIVEDAPLGTGGALSNAQAYLKEFFILMNGDSIIDDSLFEHVRNIDSLGLHNFYGRMFFIESRDTSRFGSAIIEGGVVKRFLEKNDSCTPSLINTGIYIFNRKLFAKQVVRSSLEVDLIPDFVRRQDIEGVILKSNTYFTDIGLPESLNTARSELALHLARPAVFFDRDNTLSVDSGYTFNVANFEWIPGAIQTIKEFNRRGFYVFLVTNQAGVAHGIFDENDVRNFHRHMRKDAVKHGCNIDGVLYCPHHPEGVNEKYRSFCTSRKPGAGMIERFIAHWPVVRDKSLLIGDKDTDILSASRAGIAGYKFNGGNLYNFCQEKGVLS